MINTFGDCYIILARMHNFAHNENNRFGLFIEPEVNKFIQNIIYEFETKSSRITLGEDLENAINDR